MSVQLDAYNFSLKYWYCSSIVILLFALREDMSLRHVKSVLLLRNVILVYVFVHPTHGLLPLSILLQITHVLFRRIS